MAVVDLNGRCPVCGGELGESLERFQRHDLRECGTCALQIWDPPEAPGSTWYDTSDHYLAMSVVDWLGWYHRWALAHLPGGKTLLDIGCADGRFVYAVAGQGIDARGIDHSGRLIDEGNRRYCGDLLSRASIEELTMDGQQFDIVTLFEVIEHVPDPRLLLQKAYGLLRPGGSLFVSTPDRTGYPPAPKEFDRPPHHLTRWNEAALRWALGEHYVVDEVAHSPAEIGVKELILERTQLGLVRRLLRRRAAQSGTTLGQRDVRALIRGKDRAAELAAKALVPFVGRWFRGAHMAAHARRLE